ncbi:tetratricopeptide repeat protein [Myxococcus landrumensis]|uniref:Tetratricopeptide repeat protein n=1 Tax=Myxococcus landrumensis TaxID=2813577 RepID=A0ABX7N590_9BACT|nr:tetratricopeptide repeat protein [Myxococcus landrumus]QSQ13890.1 tetratricopeptide repeat protein [Myxococcus landrumus]
MRQLICVGLVSLVTACATSRSAQVTSAGTGAEQGRAFSEAAVTVMQAYDLESRYEEAVALGQFAGERARLLKDEGGEARILAQQGRVMSRMLRHRPGMETAQVLEVLHRARRLADASGDASARVAARNSEAIFHYSIVLLTGQGEWATVVALLEQARDLAVSSGDSRGHLDALFYLGLTQQFQGNAEAARSTYEHGLSLARAAKDVLMESYNLRHLASLAEDRGELDSAITLYEQSLRLREQVGFTTGQMFALTALANVRARKDPKDAQALVLSEKSLTLARAVKDPAGEREARTSLGRLLLRRGEVAAAVPHLEQALSNSETHEDWWSAVEALLELGRAHSLRGEKVLVGERLRQARTVASSRRLQEALVLVEKVEHELGAAP